MSFTSDPLVSTKLHPSQGRSKLVARPRLAEKLDPEVSRKLVLICAPAGFGKSTLLGRWWKSRVDGGSSVAWISLDEDDNDPARFLSYLVTAFGKAIEGEIGEGVLAALGSPEPPRIEALTRVLVNELADLPGGLDLILDDYHVVDSEGVHGIVSTLLQHLPEDTRLIIASRADPPLPLARLRARGQIVELGAAELAFTQREATTFLRGVMRLDISTEDIAKLEERTEGWIAALQLAALSMRDRKDPSGFIESFSGSHRDVLDFLAEEVLERQPVHVREFLLETSILEALTGPLCDALTGHSDGNEVLEDLDRENLFVFALDDERRWYRYHHLFRDFLRNRLKRESSEHISELHLLASAWYEDEERSAEAIEHALLAPDHDLAARLLAEEARQAFSRGEVSTVLRWLEVLPTEAKRLRPRLLPQHALALALVGRPNDTEPLLKEAERVAEAGNEGERRFLLGSVSAVRSWCARLRGDAPQAIELAQRALSLLPVEEGPLRNFAAVILGDAFWTTGDLEAASEALARAVSIGRNAGFVYGTLSAMALQAHVQTERGRLREANEMLDHAISYVREQGVESLPAAGAIHLGMGAFLYERDEIEEAEHALSTGVELAELTGSVTDLTLGYVALSRTKRARGDEEGALKLAQKADRVARDYGADFEITIAHAWMSQLRLTRGEFAQEDAFEKESAPGAESGSDSSRMVERLSMARVLYARSRHREALGILQELSKDAEANGRKRDLIEILSIQALALWSSSERERAVDTLAKALSLAAPEGYVRTFVDEGPQMADLLSKTLEARRRKRLEAASKVPIHYIRKLIAALERDSAPDEGLSEPLSQRELEVLTLIAAGKSNRRIASDLYVGVGTVKTHLYNAYRKLDVNSRTEAVARASDLKLI